MLKSATKTESDAESYSPQPQPQIKLRVVELPRRIHTPSESTNAVPEPLKDTYNTQPDCLNLTIQRVYDNPGITRSDLLAVLPYSLEVRRVAIHRALESGRIVASRRQKGGTRYYPAAYAIPLNELRMWRIEDFCTLVHGTTEGQWRRWAPKLAALRVLRKLGPGVWVGRRSQIEAALEEGAL